MKKRSLLVLIISFGILTYNKCNIPDLHDKQDQKSTLTLKTIKDPDGSLSTSFLKELQEISGANVFIETGTYSGETASKACHWFNTVHTIELSPELYTQAKKCWKNSTINFHLGDSPHVLKHLLPRVNGKIIFWLDGHFSGKGTAKGITNTPVLEELYAIKECGITNAIILIDDIRCFQPFDNVPENEALQGYPTVQELYHAILEINGDYNFHIFGDVALAYHKQEGFSVSQLIQACTISRLYNEHSDVPIETIIHAENIIARATHEEKQAIEQLPNGIGSYNKFWHGLILAYNDQHQQACENFMLAIKRGLNHWRIFLHLAHSAYTIGDLEIVKYALSKIPHYNI